MISTVCIIICTQDNNNHALVNSSLMIIALTDQQIANMLSSAHFTDNWISNCYSNTHCISVGTGVHAHYLPLGVILTIICMPGQY